MTIRTKKTFWLLTMEYPPLYGGGISTYCKYWTNILSENEIAVTVFLADRHASSLTVEILNNIRLVRFSPYHVNEAPPFGYNTLVSYAFAQVIKEYMQKEGVPDVLESQEYNGLAYYTLQFKHLNYPLFKDLYVEVVCHAPSFLYLPVNKVPVYQLPYFWIGEMEKFTIRAADVLIAPSQYIIDQISKAVDIAHKEVFILPNPYASKKGIDTGVSCNQTALFYGKLSPSKGIFELLEFFSDLWERGRVIKLIIAGDENYFYHPEMRTCGDIIREKYRKEIIEEKLVLKGSLPFAQLKGIISEAKFVVIPSLIDNFPYTVLESMMLGKVVLTSLQGGQSEIIEDGINGFLFDHADSNTFINQIDKINSLDEKALRKIGDAAIKKVLKVCNETDYYNKRFQIIDRSKKNTNEFFPFTRTTVDSRENQVVQGVGEKDLLTVIIPFYNLGNFIAQTIESIYSATYGKIEVLIINDGSTDVSSLDELVILQKKHADLKIIHTKNQGLSKARNAGAARAHGEFIAFLDADDTVHPDYYSKSIALLKLKSNVHFTGCWTQYFGKSKAIWPTFNPEPPFLLVHNMVNSSALVYKRNSFLLAGLNDKEMVFGMEDYESVISMVEQGFGGIVFPEILFNYRVRSHSMARNFTKNKILYLHLAISQKHKTFYSNFAIEIINLLTANGPGYKYDNPTLDRHRLSNLSTGEQIVQRAFFRLNKYPRLKTSALKLYKYIKSKKPYEKNYWRLAWKNKQARTVVVTGKN